MSEKRKIYIKTGAVFLALFLISAVILTLIQTRNNRKDMESIFAENAEMGNYIVENVNRYNETKDYRTLMWLINGKINEFISSTWNNHKIYSSVLLLNSERKVVSRSGCMLQISTTDNLNNWYIPLDAFCSEEQAELLYRTFRAEIRGSATTLLAGEISGFLDKLDQWIPQRLTIYSQDNAAKKIVLEFNNQPTVDSKPALFTFRDAVICFPGPGSNQRSLSKADKKFLKKCDELAVRQIDTAQENQLGGGGTSQDTYITSDGVGTVIIDNELYYFAVGVQGFPLRTAITELIPLYIFLLIVMLILFFIVSHGFVKQYRQQLALSADCRTFTTEAAAGLKSPLRIIHDLCAALHQHASNDKKTKILDDIITKTEEMDDTVRNLLTSIQTKKGKKIKKNKIYFRAGCCFFLLFMAVTFILTDIQANYINKDMEESFQYEYHEMLNRIDSISGSIYTNAGDNSADRQDFASLMSEINTSIGRCSAAWSLLNMYSSILLVDINHDIISRSGHFLQCDSAVKPDGTYDILMIPLSLYCSDEQTAQIYSKLHPVSGHGNHVKVKITGYTDRRQQIIPQEIQFASQNDNEDKSFVLKLDKYSESSPVIWETNAILWLQGFGSDNRELTKKDLTIIKNCEAMVFEEYYRIPKNSGNGYGTGQTGDLSHFWHCIVVPVSIDNETCYLLVGVQGFPRQDAIIHLLPIYLFLFGLMLILFFIISRNFYHFYLQQIKVDTARQDLINAVAHELKTPLGIVRTFCEGLREKINENKKEHYINVIQKETNRMEEIVKEMSLLSQLDTGVELILQQASLNQIVDRVLGWYQASITDKGITAHLISADDSIINCDIKLMEQVISNFLSNAVRHTPIHGNITISISDDNEKVTFSIVNTGTHLPVDKIDLIWDAYYKIDSGRSNPEGSGLGLSIVKGILTAHSFEYGVKNVEAGVKFWFIAPK